MRARGANGGAPLVAAVALLAALGCGSDATSPPATTASWQPCHERFECTTIEVPVDHDAPGGPTISIALVRAPATNPESRIGGLVINPGGPGSPMVDRLVAQYGTLRLAFARVVERFDLVAFDWRGVGKSAPVRCVDDAFFDELRAMDVTLPTPADVEHMKRLRDAFVDGCRAGATDAVLASLHTENAARDLDRIREAIGDPKLTFLGLSYGTWLGATYATLFPDRVRALALDAPAFLPEDNRVQIERRAKARDAALERFFAACGSDPACAFHGGEGAVAVAEAFDAVLEAASSGVLPAGAAPLSLVDLSLGVTEALRSGDRRPLAEDLAKAEAGDGSALRARADAVVGRRADGAYDQSIHALVAIGALDLPLPPGTTMDGMASFLTGLRATSRSASSASIPWTLSVDWPWRRQRPAAPIAAKASPPALVVSTRHDPLAAHEDGVRLVAALGAGSHLVTYEGDGHVAILHSDCARSIVTEYLLEPSRPPRATTCDPE